ncbi:NB-ARC domain-containing protein, partial [Streptomyces sp. NPDC006335]|uniref:NB-ARC domain-containing protein n=1 Tax=Streptomyces sp. NPDC006335 TaxID=3156895 RepID=UPI0033A29C07
MSALLALLLALVGNAATATARWPLVDALRQDPWPWVGVFGALACVVAGVVTWMQLRPPPVRDDPPPPAPVAVPSWFVDREQTRQAVGAVCHRGAPTVGITTSLWGAGGFGKTTLATAVCAHWRVRWRFRRRIYLITIGRDVRGRAAMAAKIAEVTRFITGDTSEFSDPDLAGRHLGRLLELRPRTLLVLDDVWEEEQLAPFLYGGRPCVRLVTTRIPKLLPPGARSVHVDELSPAQARTLLMRDLPPLPGDLVDGLLRSTGRWALLLRLTNRLIVEQTTAGADPVATAEQILHRLRVHGPATVDDPTGSWNMDDPRLRNQAVQASIEAATTLLPPGGADRFSELGIFAEDESIPISLAALLWQTTGGLTDAQGRRLCQELERLSLITLDPHHGGRISLHDVLRDYLRNSLGESRLRHLNGLLIDAVAATLPPAQPLAPAAPDPERAWWQLQDGYLLDHLIDHLLASGRTADAEEVAGDVRWVETRLMHRGPSAPWNDLIQIDTPHSRNLARPLAQSAHLLTPTVPSQALTGVLHQRLEEHPYWHSQITARQQDPTQRPCLGIWWPLPDTPHAALERTLPLPDTPHEALEQTLTSDTDWVREVAIGPDGTWLAITSSDQTVRIWDRATGRCTTTLTGHTDTVGSVAISPDGSWLATSHAREVRIWDRATGRCTTTLIGHTGWVREVAIGPDGTWLATTSSDRTVRIWDRATGQCTTTLIGHTDTVESVAISPDGTWLATTSSDQTVRTWDRATGQCTASLTGYIDLVRAVAIGPDGTWLATSHDREVRIWDRATGQCTATLTGYNDRVHGVAISPDGTWLATASSFRFVHIWDRATGRCTATLGG